MTSWLALALFSAYAFAAFGWRSLVQRRRTGSTGFKGISGRPFSAEWSGGLLFAVAMVLLPLAPLLDLAGVLTAAEPSLALAVAGGALCVLGFAGTLWSQLTMGASWRIGVDAREKTALVSGGPFRLVRNPIFSAMVVAAIGFVLLVPGAVSLVALLTLVVAIELQVRLVEEPYLLRAHGADYGRYAARVGRFVPGIGRLSSSSPATRNEPRAGS